jgi:hypothetical protein
LPPRIVFMKVTLIPVTPFRQNSSLLVSFSDERRASPYVAGGVAA